jgi:acyl carrier protein
MSQESGLPKAWTRSEVEETLKQILVDALGVEQDRIVPEASLVHDLGVESIDFLDIGFRVQQTFGVDLPNKAIQEKALNWRNLGALTSLLKDRYSVEITPEDLKQFRTMGLGEVLRRVAEKEKITLQNGETEKVAEELVERLVKEIEAIGFKPTLIDRVEIKRLLLQNLNSPKIVEGMLRLFSVGSLIDFVNSRVDIKG